MKKIITILTLLIAVSFKAQTVDSTSFNLNMFSLNLNQATATNMFPFGTASYNSKITDSSLLFIAEPQFGGGIEIVDTTISMTGIDSIKVSYKAQSNSSADSINSILVPTAPLIGTTSKIQHTGLISLNVYLYPSSNLYLKDIVITEYSHTSSAGIKSFNETGLNVFTYNKTINTTGSIKQGTKINVYNSLGQVVLNTDLKNHIQTNLSTGIYTIQILNNENIIETKKCVLINNQ